MKILKPFFTILTLALLSFQTSAQTAQNPIIKNFGGIYEIPSATVFADKSIEYKIVVDAMMAASANDEINPALNNLARLLNLHGLNGTTKEKMNVVAVVHNLATQSVLSNEAYKAKFGVDNPNSQLLDELAESGVKVFVCGQSLKGRGYLDMKLHPTVTVSISALTILTTYQMYGYAALKF
jgi:intracellular sulfur oxidation DsrE/DsrF family protein